MTEEVRKITKVTRKGILLDLEKAPFNIEEIIIDFFEDDDLPSYDPRVKGLSWDYHQHRINNPEDWADDWYIDDDRLNFFWMSDENFLSFLCFVLAPENRLTYESILVKKLLEIFNNKLIHDWFEIKKSPKKVSWEYLYIWKEILWWSIKINFYTDIRNDYPWYVNDEWKAIIFDYYKWKKSYPCIVLKYDNWDDFGWNTYFSAKFYLNQWDAIDLVWVRILSKSKVTILPKNFTQLNSSFCSVVNHEELNNPELINYRLSILKWLNDIFYNTNILKTFRNNPWFERSLLRNPDTYTKVLQLDKLLLSFWIKNQNWIVNFNFDQSDLPYRINTIIWKNGCWKTSLLSNLSKEIIEYDKDNSNLINRPSFWKVIQISYSVFDEFYKPDNDFSLSKYIYCWIRDDKNKISILYLQEQLAGALKIIQQKDKKSIYTYLLNDLLDSKSIDFDKIEENFIQYSSGQKILITILAQIISNIDENSLLLFDEPETHLHPNMIFKLINALYKLLDDNNSYLIIATHSPIILQQIPAKYVYVLEEWWNRRLKDSHECFWENFSEITKEIFWNYESEDVLYKTIFKDLLNNKTENEILEFFDWNLSINAQIYLKAIYNNKKRWEI